MRIYTLMLLLCTVGISMAQGPQKPTASELYHDLQQLNFLGTALYVAAHPDDENQRMISYLANEVKARAGYLSLTRGDGGQNLIGPEIRELLGVIRTHELLGARMTDGGEQLFTRANDFGYSKHPDETLAIWNKNEVLGDVVRAIRKFKPDVIINRFNHRNPGTTHGHHTSSAMLSFEAFDLVGDPTEFPKSAAEYGAWQPKRLMFNTSWWFYGSREKFEEADKSNLVQVPTGEYYSNLGLSNGEIAGYARSMHKSQGFGSIGSRGAQTEWLELLKGDKPNDMANVFDGVDTSWSRVEGGKAIGDILYRLEKNFNFQDLAANVPELARAYSLVKNLKDDYWREYKMQQLEALILHCAGVFLEVRSDQQTVNPKENIRFTAEYIVRSQADVDLLRIKKNDGSVISTNSTPLVANQVGEFKGELAYSLLDTRYSTPYWLAEKGSLGMYKAPEPYIGLPQTPAPYQLIFELNVNGVAMEIQRPLVYRFSDPVKGEVYRPLEVVPEVTSSIAEKVLIFSSEDTREVPVTIKAGKDAVSGSVTLQRPSGWQVSPTEHTFTLNKKGEEQVVVFSVTPPKDQSEGYLRPIVKVGDVFYDKEMVLIDYDHIPYQHVLLPSEAKVARIPIQKYGQMIGYIEGAGDAIPESLKEIGYEVETIPPSEITNENLKRFDAVVVGIRAYNTVPELAFKQEILNTYVADGGNLLLQYNTAHRLVTKEFSPYPITLSRDRVTDEYSDVRLLAPTHEVLNSPNEITEADFKGWVQERGLYFPREWSEEYTAILGMSDPNAEQLTGSLLVAKHGKGHYVYTGLSFFRELPAGVPGAYRLFANLLSVGKSNSSGQ